MNTASKTRPRSHAVLVLNASFEPINICTWMRAIKLVVKDRAEIIATHDHYVHVGLLLPAVIRLTRYRHVPHRIQELTRRNIFIRDGFKCAYCLKHISHGTGLTLDHVIPRSQGGRNSWENLVSCCETCNRRKANRTPEEASMTLHIKPRTLTVHTHRSLMRNAGISEEKWRPYLFYENVTKQQESA